MVLDGLRALFYKNYRYVAFDSLGRKLITGIANTPVVTQSWERNSIGLLRSDLM